MPSKKLRSRSSRYLRANQQGESTPIHADAGIANLPKGVRRKPVSTQVNQRPRRRHLIPRSSSLPYHRLPGLSFVRFLPLLIPLGPRCYSLARFLFYFILFLLLSFSLLPLLCASQSIGTPTELGTRSFCLSLPRTGVVARSQSNELQRLHQVHQCPLVPNLTVVSLTLSCLSRRSEPWRGIPPSAVRTQ